MSLFLHLVLLICSHTSWAFSGTSRIEKGEREGKRWEETYWTGVVLAISRVCQLSHHLLRSFMVLRSRPPPVPGGHQPFAWAGACVLCDGSCTISPSAPGPGGKPPRIVLFPRKLSHNLGKASHLRHSNSSLHARRSWLAIVSGHFDSSGRVRPQSAESPMFHASSLQRGLIEAPLPRLWMRSRAPHPQEQDF